MPIKKPTPSGVSSDYTIDTLPLYQQSSFDESRVRLPHNLTPSQLELYLEDSDKCPICRSRLIESIEEEYAVTVLKNNCPTKEVLHKVGCNECFADWVDVYELEWGKTLIRIESVSILTNPSVKFILED